MNFFVAIKKQTNIKTLLYEWRSYLKYVKLTYYLQHSSI
jgi:hypothetical protein